MKIAIASDHAGYEYKQEIVKHLQQSGHKVIDLGTDSNESVDYPDYIYPASRAVVDGECERAVILGGSGNGEAMTANRLRGIRCALCWNDETAELARKHNNANMISIGQRMITPEQALKCVDIWLETEFEGGRHQRRIEKIDSVIDPKYR